MRVASPNIANIALKVLYVNYVKANNGCKQSDICLGEYIAVIVWSIAFC